MLLPLLVLSVTGCAAGHSSAGTRPCGALSLVHYTAAQQTALAGELDQAVDEGSVWPNFIVDYERLRDMVRACEGISK